MKNFCVLLFFFLLSLFVACSPQGMQGHPAAIQAGAAVGGVLGSIVGDRAGGYPGSQFGALIGTVAGVVVGNAVSSPSVSESDGLLVKSAPLPSAGAGNVSASADPLYTETPLASGLRIMNLRFIDANRNHIIDAEEDSKLVFDLLNEGPVPLYHVTPVVEEISGMKHLLISPSVSISYMDVGDRIRYTVTVRGGRRLRTGQVQFRVYASESSGTTTSVHTFQLPIQKRGKK